MSDDETKPFPRGDGDNKNRLLASANWSHEIQPYKPGMIWLGRDQNGNAVGTADDRHVSTTATNRSGKGTGLIIPNLCLWPGSTVVIDPKGENAARTARNRGKIKGHQVVVLDPFDEAGLPPELCGTFNPLDMIDIKSDDAVDIAGVIADAMIVKSNSKDTHWDESARDLIAGLILHVCDTEESEERNLGRVRQLLIQGDPDARDILAEREETGTESVSAFDGLWEFMKASEAANENIREFIIGTAESLLATGHNERGGILSTARRNTRFLSTPKIRKLLATTSFDIDALKTSKGGMSIYLCLPARMFPTHARFLRLIISLLLFRMEEIGLEKPANGHPVLFILDEFASLGYMEMLEKAAGLMAGYGVKLWTITQDLSQMKKHYKESWETFLANAGTSIFFANSDLTTLEWLSKRMGETEIIRENKGSSVSSSQGSSTTQGASQSEGTTYSDGQSNSQSDMAPLSQTATIQGGASILDVFTRRFQSSASYSYSASKSDGGSSQNSQSQSATQNQSDSQSTSKNEQILKTPLMTPDEIASHFDRESGRAVAFIGGKGPFMINRTPYYEDEAFKGLYTEDVTD
jgi:type IV secretory pathway TraG/TraD family ATPase VirD4